jgi:hypothetical protein
MAKPFRNKLVLLCLCISIQLGGRAQREFVVKVDPATASFGILDSAPGAKYVYSFATFDETGKQFLFQGWSEDISGHILFGVNALTGKLASRSVLPNGGSLGSMAYDNGAHILYGIVFAAGEFSLVTIDISGPTAVYTTIASLSSIHGMGEEMIIDENNHRIYINCNDSTNSASLLVLDMNGKLLADHHVSGLNGLRYDHLTNKMYGLYNYQPYGWQLVEVNTNTGGFSVISTIAASLAVYQNHETYDERRHRYIFAAVSSNTPRLFSVDVTTGTVLSDPALLPGTFPKENLGSFRYSNSLGQLFALHWGRVDPPNTSTVYMNGPGSLQVRTNNTGPISLGLYNSSGQKVMTNQSLLNGTNNLRLPQLRSTGIYFYKLYTSSALLQSGRLFIGQ